MKITILLSILLLLVNSCKKSKLSAENPLIGKWSINGFDFENKYPSVIDQGIVNEQILKKTILEITNKGDVLIGLNNEKEKLKIIKIDEIQLNTMFYKSGLTTKKFICKVKNHKGQIFTFNFFANSDKTKLIATYWTPNHPFVLKDSPNYSPLCLNIPTTNTTSCNIYFAEFFGDYSKL